VSPSFLIGWPADSRASILFCCCERQFSIGSSLSELFFVKGGVDGEIFLWFSFRFIFPVCSKLGSDDYFTYPDCVIFASLTVTANGERRDFGGTLCMSTICCFLITVAARRFRPQSSWEFPAPGPSGRANLCVSQRNGFLFRFFSIVDHSIHEVAASFLSLWRWLSHTGEPDFRLRHHYVFIWCLADLFSLAPFHVSLALASSWADWGSWKLGSENFSLLSA
jgi:hypothetical protein